MLSGTFCRRVFVWRAVVFSPRICQKASFSTPPSGGEVTSTGKRPSGVLIPDNEEQLCEANLFDYQSVVAIDPHLHQGLDRLPYNYPSYIHGTNVQGFVYKKGSRVVGFTSIQLVDGGQTLTALAGRLAPDCRDDGMYERFARRLIQEYNRKSEIRYNTQTITDEGTSVGWPRKWLKDEYKVLEKLGKVWDVDIKVLDNSQSPVQLPNPTKVRRMICEDVLTMLFKGPAEVRHLFPEGRLLGNPRMPPCRIMVENIDDVCSLYSAILVSGECGPAAEPGSMFPGTLLTYSDLFFCKPGICYTVDICGTGSVEELRAHFKWHLERLTFVNDREERRTAMLVTFPPQLSDTVEELAETIPIIESFDCHHNILEKSFPLSPE